MFSIYVTNKSRSRNVYIRLHHEKLSSTIPSFYHDLDTKKDATRHLVQCGFFVITPKQTISFPTDRAIGGTHMYASLYAVSTLWIMDFEINCTRYGCLFVDSKEFCGKTTFHLRQANPEPVWIPAKTGNSLPLYNIVKAGPQNYFGRLSNLGTPCRVTIASSRIGQWFPISGKLRHRGELLRDTGHVFVRANAGDDVPPHGVISGVSEPGGSMYLGRIGGNIPCSIITESEKIKYFLYATKKVQSGEILVLTNDPNI